MLVQREQAKGGQCEGSSPANPTLECQRKMLIHTNPMPSCLAFP